MNLCTAYFPFEFNEMALCSFSIWMNFICVFSNFNVFQVAYVLIIHFFFRIWRNFCLNVEFSPSEKSFRKHKLNLLWRRNEWKFEPTKKKSKKMVLISSIVFYFSFMKIKLLMSKKSRPKNPKIDFVPLFLFFFLQLNFSIFQFIELKFVFKVYFTSREEHKNDLQYNTMFLWFEPYCSPLHTRIISN